MFRSYNRRLSDLEALSWSSSVPKVEVVHWWWRAKEAAAVRRATEKRERERASAKAEMETNAMVGGTGEDEASTSGTKKKCQGWCR